MSTVEGSLKDGLEVGDQVYRDYEIRAATAGDMFDAENDAPANKQVAYRAALLARQLVKLGELSGPIDFKLMRKLTPRDLDQLLADQQQADDAGESSPSS